jgi:hypothetical protein
MKTRGRRPRRGGFYIKEGDSKGRERDIEWKKVDIPPMERVCCNMGCLKRRKPYGGKMKGRPAV